VLYRDQEITPFTRPVVPPPPARSVVQNNRSMRLRDQHDQDQPEQLRLAGYAGVMDGAIILLAAVNPVRRGGLCGR